MRGIQRKSAGKLLQVQILLSPVPVDSESEEIMFLTKLEQETTINYNQDEPNADIYTCDRRLQHKLESLAEKDPQVVKISEDNYSKRFTIPKRYISIRIPKVLTEESKQKLVSRLQKIRSCR